MPGSISKLEHFQLILLRGRAAVGGGCFKKVFDHYYYLTTCTSSIALWLLDVSVQSLFVSTNWVGNASLINFHSCSGWLVLGGTYDTTSGTVDRSNGMVGRLSRLHISTSPLSSADVSRLYADTSFVPTGSQLLLTKDLLNATSAAVDYESQLTQGLCLTSATCRSIDQGNVTPWPACPQSGHTPLIPLGMIVIVTLPQHCIEWQPLQPWSALCVANAGFHVGRWNYVNHPAHHVLNDWWKFCVGSPYSINRLPNLLVCSCGKS